MYTPSVQEATGATFHTTNAKGERSGFKGETPSPMDFTPGMHSNESPFLAQRFMRERDQARIEEEEHSDSINARILSPDKEFEKYKTPNVLNRVKAYKQIDVTVNSYCEPLARRLWSSKYRQRRRKGSKENCEHPWRHNGRWDGWQR